MVFMGDSGRGRFVTRLDDIPLGFVGTTAKGLVFERLGNVVRLGNRFLEIAFREMTLCLWQPEHDAGSLSLLGARLVDLLAMLDELDLMALGRVNKRLRNVVTEPVLWMHLFARRFGFLPPFLGTGRGFWMARFAHQRREVASFGSLVFPENNKTQDDLLKRVVLMGPLGAGKTSLVASLTRRHEQSAETAPSTFVRTSVAWGFVGGLSHAGCKFWDIPGDPRNRSVASVYCSTAHALVFVYRPGEAGSFQLVRDWVLEVKRSVKTADKTLLLIASGSGAVDKSEIDFARHERLAFIRENLTVDNGFEWKLWLFKLCSMERAFL